MKHLLKNKYVQGIIILLIGGLLSRSFPFSHEGYTSNKEYKKLEEEYAEMLIERGKLSKELSIVKLERDTAKANSTRLAEGIRVIDEELKGLIHEREIATRTISNARTTSELINIFTELNSLAGNR